MIIAYFLEYYDGPRSSRSPLHRPITFWSWIRFGRKSYQLKGISLRFQLAAFWSRIDTYLRTYGDFTEMGLTFLQEPWQMSYDRHDHCLRLAILRQPSILTIATSQAHNFLVMDPFLTKELPTERYQSPLSVGGTLVSNRHVFKNLREFYENGSDIFARALAGIMRSS